MIRASHSPLPAIGAGSALAIALLTTIGFLGCDVPHRPDLSPSEARASSNVGLLGETSTSDLTPPEVSTSSWDVWNAHFIGDKQVGYGHSVCKEDPKNRNEMQYELENCFYVPHGRAQVLQRLNQKSTEFRNGTLKKFEASLQMGPVVRQFAGVVDDSSLSIETLRGNTTRTRQVDWSPEHWGLAALELTLREDPMLYKKQNRVLKMLMPGTYTPATAKLTCRGIASVPLIDDSSKELFEIDCEISVDDDNRTYITMWTDERGEVMRTLRPALQLVSYRTDKATALDFDGNEKPPVYIAAEGSLERPDETERVGYLVGPIGPIASGDRLSQFPPGPGQFVQPDPEGGYRVVVTRGGETEIANFEGQESASTSLDVRSTKLVNSNNSLVKQHAEVAVGPRTLTNRETALALAQAANRMYDPDAEYHGLVRASDTALLGQGGSADCAVFLAAMLRARKIPSQLAFGFTYQERGDGLNRFVFDVWTIAFVDDQWLHLDVATAAEAGADRLVLSTSPLADENEYKSLAPFLDLMGRLQIKIQKAQHRSDG